MRRRGFLKALLGGAAAALIPASLVKAATPKLKPDFPAYTIPGMNRLPKKSIVGKPIQVMTPTFDVGGAIDWQLEHCRDARWDMVQRAVDILVEDVKKKQDKKIWEALSKGVGNGDLVTAAYDVQALPSGAAVEFPLTP
jgi:hypothetical protein